MLVNILQKNILYNISINLFITNICYGYFPEKIRIMYFFKSLPCILIDEFLLHGKMKNLRMTINHFLELQVLHSRNTTFMFKEIICIKRNTAWNEEFFGFWVIIIFQIQCPFKPSKQNYNLLMIKLRNVLNSRSLVRHLLQTNYSL